VGQDSVEPTRNASAARTGTGDAFCRANNNPLKVLKKILLIDHEPAVTRLIKQALEKTGRYSIKEEFDTKFALHCAKWYLPDLILLDGASAVSDRDILARQIQADNTLRGTPVVCLSSLRSESEMMSGGILSGYSFFAAPIRLDEVLRGVEQLLFGKD
jgi:DNA-binding response OmpR family regulator